LASILAEFFLQAIRLLKKFGVDSAQNPSGQMAMLFLDGALAYELALQ